MKTTKWRKVYKGGFDLKEDAQKLVDHLKEKAHPEFNGIYDAKVRKRYHGIKCVCTCACGAGLGHNIKYDVYVKMEKEMFDNLQLSIQTQKQSGLVRPYAI